MRPANEPRPDRPSGRGGAIAAVALAVAAAGAILVPPLSVGGPLRGVLLSGASWAAWRTGSGVNPAETADRSLPSLRALLPTGSHAGYMVPYSSVEEFIKREVDVQSFYAAQYALAPAVLTPIYVPECLARGAWACGMGRMDFLLARPGTEAVAPLAADLGFGPVFEVSGVTLLGRRR